jgi:hypothetical protein
MRNFIDMITEGRHNTYTVMGVEVPTIDRPSRREFEGMLANSEHGVLRGMSEENDLTIWDAALSTHDHMGDGDRIVLTSNMVLFYPDDDEDCETTLEEQADWFRENKFLVRIYGSTGFAVRSYYDRPDLHIG